MVEITGVSKLNWTGSENNTTTSGDNQLAAAGKMTELTKLVTKLTGLQTAALNQFDNSSTDTMEDFLKDFDHHVRATELTTEQQKLDCLVAQIAGSVPSWYRYQAPTTQIIWGTSQGTHEDIHTNRTVKTFFEVSLVYYDARASSRCAILCS